MHLFAAGAPHKDALIAAAQPGSDFYGLEVKLPKANKAADPADTAAKAVGIATGAAALGVELGIARWWGKRKKAQAEQTAASAALLGPCDRFRVGAHPSRTTAGRQSESPASPGTKRGTKLSETQRN
jgi:hypothetical protein